LKGFVFASPIAMRTLVATALVLMAGCSSIPKTIEKPEVALQGIDIQKASLTDATVLLKLEVRNPNPFALEVDRMKYGLELNGKSFAQGTMKDGVEIAADGDGEIVVPVRMKYWDLFSQFKDVVKGKVSNYVINGTLTSGDRDFPFTKKGELKLPES
jgi:LEA14-like dessication related protein